MSNMQFFLNLALAVYISAILLKFVKISGIGDEIMSQNNEDLNKMDIVDSLQQMQIDNLLRVDQKHDRQFSLILLLNIVLIVWNLSLTFSLIK